MSSLKIVPRVFPVSGANLASRRSSLATDVNETHVMRMMRDPRATAESEEDY